MLHVRISEGGDWQRPYVGAAYPRTPRIGTATTTARGGPGIRRTLFYRADRAAANARGDRGFAVPSGESVTIYERAGAPDSPEESFRVKTVAGEEGWIARADLEEIRIEPTPPR